MTNTNENERLKVTRAAEQTSFKLCGAHHCVHNVTTYVLRNDSLVVKLDVYRGVVTAYKWHRGWLEYVAQLPDHTDVWPTVDDLVSVLTSLRNAFAP